MAETFDDLFVTEKEHKERSTFRPYNREEWLAGKKQERAEAFALLEEATKASASDPKAFTDYLDTQAAFDRYSVSNCLLIAHQNPNVLQLADYNTWKDQGIFVNRGETGIMILEPGNEYTREDGSTGFSMNVKRVFDISQTSAAENGADTKTYELRLVLKALMAESPVDLKVTDSLPDTVNGAYSSEDNAIYLRQGMDGDSIFRAMAYEITLVKTEQKGERDEYAAQAATYILCQRFSIGGPPIEFSACGEYFAGKEPKELRAALEKIRSLANDLSQPMIRTLERPEKQRSEKPHNDDAR